MALTPPAVVEVALPLWELNDRDAASVERHVSELLEAAAAGGVAALEEEDTAPVSEAEARTASEPAPHAADRFALWLVKRNQKLEEARKQLQQEREAVETLECSFSPSTLPRSRSGLGEPAKPLLDRLSDWDRRRQARVAFASEQAGLEELAPCTFKPEMIAAVPSPAGSTGSSRSSQADVAAFVSRMAAARQRAETQKAALEQLGMPKLRALGGSGGAGGAARSTGKSSPRRPPSSPRSGGGGMAEGAPPTPAGEGSLDAGSSATRGHPAAAASSAAPLLFESHNMAALQAAVGASPVVSTAEASAAALSTAAASSTAGVAVYSFRTSAPQQQGPPRATLSSPSFQEYTAAALRPPILPQPGNLPTTASASPAALVAAAAGVVWRLNVHSPTKHGSSFDAAPQQQQGPLPVAPAPATDHRDSMRVVSGRKASVISVMGPHGDSRRVPTTTELRSPAPGIVAPWGGRAPVTSVDAVSVRDLYYRPLA